MINAQLTLGMRDDQRISEHMSAGPCWLVEDSSRSIAAERRQVAFSDRAFRKAQRSESTLVREHSKPVGSAEDYLFKILVIMECLFHRIQTSIQQRSRVSA